MIGQALRCDSSYAAAYVKMGDIHTAESHIDRAVEAYSRALTIDPKLFVALLSRAKLYMEVGEWKLAATDLEDAATVKPHSGQVYSLRAKCYEMIGEKEKARAGCLESPCVRPPAMIAGAEPAMNDRTAISACHSPGLRCAPRPGSRHTEVYG